MSNEKTFDDGRRPQKSKCQDGSRNVHLVCVSVLKGSSWLLLFASGEICASLEKWLKDRFGSFVIVMDDVDKEGGVHQVVDELTSWGVRFIVLCPLAPQFVRLILK